MFPIAYLSTVTDVISEQVAAEVASGPNNKATTAGEIEESQTKQAEVMALLDMAISKTSALKTQMQSVKDDNASSISSDAVTLVDRDEIATEVADLAAANAPGAPADPNSVAKSIADGLTAKDPKSLENQTKTLSEMAKAAEPIVKTFDSILSKPGLNSYNATVNTAPVMGFKDGNIMYINTKTNRYPTGNVTNDVWSVFSKVPDGFDLSKGAVHFFPYQGDLYVSNGSTMWQRKARPRPALDAKEVVNNWPKLYLDSWTKIGDNCLPSKDILDMVPWAKLTADGQNMKFQLIALAKNGTLNVLKGDTISSQNSFDTLAYADKSEVPVWTRIAYYNGILVGYDTNYNLWDIKPDFTKNTYTIENKYAIGQDDPFVEFTANDIGLVVVKKDGYLYKRIAATVDTSDAPKDGSDDKTKSTKWVKWIAADGVQKLGVASPGVILDLETLTKSLKSRYLETQATLWPVVNNIKTFAGTHEVFLKQLNRAAKEYDESYDDAKKQKAALNTGKKAVGHAKAWSKILTTSVQNAREPVAAMARQLSDVHKDLEQQIGLLNVKLVELRGVLKEQKKALSAARIGFWAGIGAMLLGVVVVIAGLATANPLVIAGGGVLFVGGIITASIYASKADAAAAAVAKTESEITKVETAIREMTAVTANFKSIDDMYGMLNQFWGRMLGECMSVTSSDEALLTMIGEKLIMENAVSYEYAMECTGRLKEGAQAYMDLISAQGITIDLGDDEDEEEDGAVASLASVGPEDSLGPSENNLTEKQLVVKFANAQDALQNGDDDVYEALMEEASEATLASATSSSQELIRAGAWFETAALKANAGVFLTTALKAGVSGIGLGITADLLKGARAIGSLVQAQKKVCESLQATIEMAKLLSQWDDDPFSEKAEDYQRQMEKYKKPAVNFCRLARDAAAIANNSFADINHQVQDFAISSKQQIQAKKDEIRVLYARMDSELRQIDVPFPLQLFAPRSKVMDWVLARSAEIQGKYDNQVKSLDDVIAQLESSQNSWVTVAGQAVTWVEMCKVINKNLADTQSILDSMGKEIRIDALLYKELMVTQWHRLVSNAAEILTFVGLNTGNKVIQFPPQLGGFSFEFIANGNVAALMSVEIDDSTEAQLKAAVAPDQHLSRVLTQCTSANSAFFTALKDLEVLPYAAEINSGTSSKHPKTMLEIVADIRRQYSNLAAANFETVSFIRMIAQTREIALKRPASARRDVLIKEMLTLSTMAFKAALRTSKAFSDAQEEFSKISSLVQSNVQTYRALMKDLSAAAAKQQKELDDYIAGMVADAVALLAVSAAIGATVAFGPKAGWTVIGKLTAIYGVAGLGWKDMFKTFYKSLDVGEKAAAIANLKSFESNLETASKRLTNANESFNAAAIGIHETELAVGRMHGRLLDLNDRIQSVMSTKLEQSDVDEIVFNWKEVGAAAEGWMDEFSTEGISPILGQFDEDVMDAET